jgi:hypothetical protein
MGHFEVQKTEYAQIPAFDALLLKLLEYSSSKKEPVTESRICAGGTRDEHFLDIETPFKFGCLEVEIARRYRVECSSSSHESWVRYHDFGIAQGKLPEHMEPYEAFVIADGPDLHMAASSSFVDNFSTYTVHSVWDSAKLILKEGEKLNTEEVFNRILSLSKLVQNNKVLGDIKYLFE